MAWPGQIECGSLRRVATFRVDDDARAAIVASSLGSLPQEVVELIADARRLHLPARSTFHDQGEDSPHLELVMAGLIRVQVSAADGRTLTVRYCVGPGRSWA